MKPKIELNKEYPTRGGGKAVVYRDDGHPRYPLIGAAQHNGIHWHPQEWSAEGWINPTGKHPNDDDILLPRTVLVPVTVPEWAKSVRILEYGQLAFSGDPADSVLWISIEDWIASL